MKSLLTLTFFFSFFTAAYGADQHRMIAPGFTALIPNDWKADPTPENEHNRFPNVGKITAAYWLPSGAYIQFHYSRLKNSALEYIHPNDMYEDMLEVQSICCQWNLCLREPLDPKEPPGTAVKHECTYESVDFASDFASQTFPLTASEASGIGHRKSGDLSVYVTLKRKNISKDATFLTVTYSIRKSEISPDARRLYRKMIKSIR